MTKELISPVAEQPTAELAKKGLLSGLLGQKKEAAASGSLAEKFGKLFVQSAAKNAATKYKQWIQKSTSTYFRGRDKIASRKRGLGRYEPIEL